MVHIPQHIFGMKVPGAANELIRMMKVREKILKNLSENSLPLGAPYSSLEEILVPMYLFHRYQIEAASKVVGGLDYSYSLKGDRQLKTAMIPPKAQWEAPGSPNSNNTTKSFDALKNLTEQNTAKSTRILQKSGIFWK